MSRFSNPLAPLVLSVAVSLSPVPLMAKPNILPGDAAKHLPKLSQETIERRALLKEQRAKAREERRLKRLERLERKSKPSD